MKIISLLLLFNFTCNVLLFAQDKNVLFNDYTIGDPINKHADRLYIYDKKNKQYLKADNLEAWQYVYFPEIKDSSVFPVLKFNTVFVRTDKEGKLVASIWLLDPVAADTSNNVVLMSYNTIKNYLDEKLKVTPEVQNSNTYFGKDMKSWVWRTENLDYHLNVQGANHKKGEKNVQLSVIID
jgi:hypothetical protein